jgi:hypothetical protein
MDGANYREVYSICGRELSFKLKLNQSFLDWCEINIEGSSSKEICTKFIENLDIKQGDESVYFINDDEKLEIYNIIAKEHDFNSTQIHSCNEFAVCLKEYYQSYLGNTGDRIEEFNESVKSIARFFGSVGVVLQNLSKKIGSSIDLDKIESFFEVIEKLPDSVKEMHEKLMLQGWYLPLSVLLELKPSYAYSIIDSDIAEINDKMLLLAQDIEENLLPEIEENFNNRYEFISKSLQYHKEGNYNISIPIMLIHADGITLDIFNNNLFTSQHKRKKIAEEFLKDGTLRDSLGLYPLSSDSAISANRNARKGKKFYRFNRHEILHGEDLDYGTKENSYRCIMLLKYLIDVGDYTNEYKQELD